MRFVLILRSRFDRHHWDGSLNPGPDHRESRKSLSTDSLYCVQISLDTTENVLEKRYIPSYFTLERHVAVIVLSRRRDDIPLPWSSRGNEFFGIKNISNK